MKKKNKRLKLPYAVLLITSLLFLIGGGLFVYAAVTKVSDREENNFQVGNLETKAKENFIEPSNPLEPDKETWTHKQVGIKNEGTIKQFVRVMVFPELKIAGTNVSTLLPNIPGTTVKLADDQKKQNLPVTWKLGEDGYYYYLEALDPDEATKDYLFEFVQLDKSLASEYNGASFSITVKVEAINCAPYAYREAWWEGWTPTAGELKNIDNTLKELVEK